jgi:23S rRNA (pseudouridine1915-N3)-methyltransferase
MRIRLLQIGKNQDDYVKSGMEHFVNKLKHYCQFEIVTLQSPKNSGQLTSEALKKLEGELLLKQIDGRTWVCLLDNQGKSFDSPGFARQIEQWALAGRSQVDFIIGGAFGFSAAVYQRADYKLSLSAMTFSHQIVRLIFLEQLYRAFTIIKNEPYHHG